MRELEGKVAVVTGAASGIGAALADALAAGGAALALLDVAEEPLAEIAARTGGLAIRCDLTDDAEVEAAAARVVAELGVPDLLFANAGVASVGPALSSPIADARWVLDVNVLGAIRTTRAFAPAMVARGDGAICFTASIAGLIGAPGMPIYSASKHALVGFAESLRVELAGSGVGITVVCPGRVDTGLHAATATTTRASSASSTAPRPASGSPPTTSRAAPSPRRCAAAR